jgi:hypothetical protein
MRHSGPKLAPPEPYVNFNIFTAQQCARIFQPDASMGGLCAAIDEPPQRSSP